MVFSATTATPGFHQATEFRSAFAPSGLAYWILLFHPIDSSAAWQPLTGARAEELTGYLLGPETIDRFQPEPSGLSLSTNQ